MGIEETKPVVSETHRVKVFVVFFFVGTGCGWFVGDAVFQMVANESALQRGGAMFGTLSMVMGFSSLVQCVLYFSIFSLGSVNLSVKVQQHTTSALLVLSVAVMAQLAFTWDMGAPDYLMVPISGALGALVANTTYLIVFPLITTYYGGWIIAPVRAGTDSSSLVTGLLGEAQNPSGSRILFPTRTLLLLYAGICSMGIVAWSLILNFRISLKGAAVSPSADTEAASHIEEINDCTSTEVTKGHEGFHQSEVLAIKDKLLRQFHGLACSREFLVPITIAIVAEIMQWGVLVNFGPIGAKMTDPNGCDGTQGQLVYRTALTVNRILVPLGSVVSSIASCPKWLLCALGCTQLIACALMCSATFGLAQSFWMAPAGQVCYIVVYAIIGGLEGYLLTMAYRCIGDSEIAGELREGSSRLLSFLSVFLVNIVQIALGSLVSSSIVSCSST
jgi:hypothetical protein